MIQDPNNNSKFTISPGEPFSVVFTPFPSSMTCLTTLDADIADCEKVSQCPDVYSVDTSLPSGSVITLLGLCDFPPGADDNAYYDISVRDQDGHSYAVTRVPKGGYTKFAIVITIS